MWDLNILGSAASILGLGLSIYALVEVRRLKINTQAAIANATRKQRLTFSLVELERLLGLIADSQSNNRALVRALPTIRNLLSSCQHGEFVTRQEKSYFRGTIVELQAIRQLDQSSKRWLSLLEARCQGLKHRWLDELNSGGAGDVV